MGFIRTTLEDLEWLSQIFVKIVKEKRIIPFLLIVIILYLVVDLKILSQELSNKVTLLGLSVFNKVELQTNIYEIIDDYANDPKTDFKLKINYSGKVIPEPSNGSKIQIDLKNIDKNEIIRSISVSINQGEFSSKENIINTNQYKDNNFYINEFGKYCLVFTLKSPLGLKLAGKTYLLEKVNSYVYKDNIKSLLDELIIDKNNFNKLIDKKNNINQERNLVNILYFSKQDFNKIVFENLLVNLNLILNSIEFQIIDSDLEQISRENLPDDENGYLEKLEEIEKKEKLNDNQLIVGITPKTFSDNKLYLLRGNKLIISTDELSQFNLHSEPSIYKYLFSSIIPFGITNNYDFKFNFHPKEITRGCIFDYSLYKPRAKLGVKTGYICSFHRKYFSEKLSKEEFKDLTEINKLEWLK